MNERILEAGVSHHGITASESASLVIDQNAETLIDLKGDSDINIQWHLDVRADTRAVVFFINEMEHAVSLHIEADVAQNAQIRIAYLGIGTGTVKLFGRVYLNEEGASSDFNTASVCKSALDYDVETVHRKGHTTGTMENYGLVMNESTWKLVCAGKIDKYAVGAESHQTSRILTFAQPKNVTILPILYIDENDVKASHATSLGQPDENVLYYMESRGLDREASIRLITAGYIRPIARVFSDEGLSQEVEERIETKVGL